MNQQHAKSIAKQDGSSFGMLLTIQAKRLAEKKSRYKNYHA
jgi:hypothetical protein